MSFRIDLKWPEMWPMAVILSKIKNVIENEFRTSKMGAGGQFLKIFWKKSFELIWNGQKLHRKWVLDIQNGRRQPFCKKNHKNKYYGIDLKW